MGLLKRKRILIVPLIVFLCAALLFTPFKNGLVFFESRTTNLVAYVPLQSEQQFQIRYTHSIHLSDVIESYEVSADQFILQALEYEDFAIGMPSGAEEGETFRQENGKYYIENMNRSMADFTLFVGDIDEDLVLRYENQEYDLKKYLKRGESFRFEPERLSLFQLMKGVNISG